jgi:hypothetical protein
MGTTLTGTTPQDTYDSLIKVTDNGPISGTLKALSDGLGNDSALALSTGAASITGTLAVSANTGIGTAISSWDGTFRALQIGLGTTIYNNSTVNGSFLGSNYFYNGTNNIYKNTGTASAYGQVNGTHTFFSAASGTAGDAVTFSEKMTITSTGNVGIGTSSVTSLLTLGNSYIGGGAYEALRSTGSPTALVAGGANVITRVLGGDYGAASTASLDLSCAIAKNLGVANTGFRITAGTGAGESTSNGFLTFSSLTGTVSSTFTATERLRLDSDGLKFNGDTAAANALDDYEEGTWTMGVSFGGASVGVTYGANTGTYTKIGRQVTVNGYLALSNKGSSTGAALITGLPFTVANSTANYSAPTLRFTDITFANQFQGFGTINTTTIELNEITILGVVSNLTNADFTNNSDIIVSLTYFV